MRPYLFSVLLLLFCSLPIFAAAADSKLELEVYSFVLSDDTAPRGERYVMRLRMFIRNTGESTVTTATSTPTGGWSGLTERGDARSLIYSIGYGDVAGAKVVQSPFRHFPVELRPGELTELPMKEFRMAKRSGITKVTVTFSVDADFAERFGWWSGRLRSDHVVGEGPNPFVEPMREPIGDIR